MLKGKVALVTGSTSGIGFSIALDLLKRGCSVVMTGSRTSEEAKLCIEKANAIGPAAYYIQCDLYKDTTLLCSEVDRLFPEGVDILVNNAGIGQILSIGDTTEDIWNRIISINLTAPFVLTRHFLQRMKAKKWGRIINVSSIFGVTGKTDLAAYVSSKHGLIGLTKATALEVAPDGITVNALCPGLVDTQMAANYFEIVGKMQGIDFNEAKESVVENFHPNRKMLISSQVSAMVVFLCSEESSNTTGSSFVMDGGYTAR